MAQTAEEIVAKHLAAVGGKARLAGIKTLYTKGEIRTIQASIPVTHYLSGKNIRTEMSGVEKIISVSTPHGGWTLDETQPDARAHANQNNQPELFSLAFELLTVLAYYDEADAAVSLGGQELVDKEMTYKISFSSPRGRFFFWISTLDFYIVQAATMELGDKKGRPLTFEFSKYSATDYGILMPHLFQLSMAGRQTHVELYYTIEINKTFEDTVFEMPEEASEKPEKENRKPRRREWR